MKNKKNGIILILTLITLISCDKNEPGIDYNKLIIGQWTETKATDSFTDFNNASNNLQTDVTNESFTLTFLNDLKFNLAQTIEKLDSGDYYFSDFENNKLINTHSVDNIRIPKTFNMPTMYSTYQVTEITNDKLILKSKILDSNDPNGNLLTRREFIWELSRQ